MYRRTETYNNKSFGTASKIDFYKLRTTDRTLRTACNENSVKIYRRRQKRTASKFSTVPKPNFQENHSLSNIYSFQPEKQFCGPEL